MSAHIAAYKGKPTAYLDQNILDLFVKGIAIDLAEALTRSFQIVFSDETLKEIRRSGDHAEDFLIVLRRLNAHHLKNHLEQPGFIPTDQATITACDPFAAYDQYCKNVGSYLDIMKSMEQWLYKFSGGRVGDGIAEIHGVLWGRCNPVPQDWQTIPRNRRSSKAMLCPNGARIQ